MSIEHKLPLLIGGLLLGVIVAITVAAYATVRGTSTRIASERLSAVTRQFRDLFQQSGVQLRASAAVAAKQPALRDFARSRAPSARARALEALKYTGPNANQVIGEELRDSTGAVILSTALSRPEVAAMSVSDVVPRSEPGDSATLGGFRLLNDTLVYPIAAHVEGTDGVYLVRWRKLVGSRRTREQFSQLIGSEASMFLGDPRTKNWTDLENPVAAPAVDLASRDSVQTYRDSSDTHLAAVARVPGTPWAVAFSFPMSNVLAPVKEFERRIAIIALLALGIALLGALIASRRITDPLKQLSRAQLEQAVTERTGELNKALSELHDAQEALVRRERLAMLGQLSSGVGHELRNPLGVMTNAVYYLKTVLATQPTNVQEYLDIIQQQVTISEKIVADLLDFTRSKPPQRKPTPLRQATDAQITRIAPGKLDRVKVEVDIPEDLPSAMVDPIQLGQIVINLVTNAAQAMDGNGRITVRARNAGGNRIAYEVSDTGPGVPADIGEKVFEPLFTTKARGIGLGLAVSRMLARANGGDLTLNSKPGEGATFLLTLDMDGAPSLPASQPRSPVPA
jgi:signal transduction histidine kinase